MPQDKASKTPILVVDDDGDIRLALEMLLQYEGYEVWTARDGVQALARMKSELEGTGRRPGLVLTDLKMPELDGLGLLAKIGELESPPPVILISGHADVAVAVEAMQKGAANFLEKPLVDNRVLVTIEGALLSARLTRENRASGANSNSPGKSLERASLPNSSERRSNRRRTRTRRS